jgi:lactoylglutathione lyase
VIAFIHSTTVIVADLERSIDFYVDTLGWELRIDAPMPDGTRFVTVAPPGGQAELALAPASRHGVQPGRSLSLGAGMEGVTGISLAVEEVEATYRTLVERGVRFSGPLEEMAWGDRASWLMDPDGNRFFFTGR